MEKHITLGFDHLMELLKRYEHFPPHEIPTEILDLVPIVLLVIAAIVLLVSIAGIIGGAGVLKRREWGRILLLVVSFFNLARIPLGTVLGIYSIWVLLNDETIRLFNPAAGHPSGSVAS